MEGISIQLKPLQLHFTPYSALKLSKMLNVAMDTLGQTDNVGNYEQNDFEFCHAWSQAFEAHGQAMLSRMCANLTELATLTAKERGI